MPRRLAPRNPAAVVGHQLGYFIIDNAQSCVTRLPVAQLDHNLIVVHADRNHAVFFNMLDKYLEGFTITWVVVLSDDKEDKKYRHQTQPNECGFESFVRDRDLLQEIGKMAPYRYRDRQTGT